MDCLTTYKQNPSSRPAACAMEEQTSGSEWREEDRLHAEEDQRAELALLSPPRPHRTPPSAACARVSDPSIHAAGLVVPPAPPTDSRARTAHRWPIRKPAPPMRATRARRGPSAGSAGRCAHTRRRPRAPRAHQGPVGGRGHERPRQAVARPPAAGGPEQAERSPRPAACQFVRLRRRRRRLRTGEEEASVQSRNDRQVMFR